MKIDRAIELIKIERECVSRSCDNNCASCDLVQDTPYELIEMYDFVLSMLEIWKGAVKQDATDGSM